METASSKIIGLIISLFASCALADSNLPKCVIFTFGNCLGKLQYPNGDIYNGEFNYGQPNGNGKMTYATGDLYVGVFYLGQKHGMGDYTWADGNRYIGQFVDGNLEGRGAYYFIGKNKTNPDKYLGEFKRNVFNGDGVYTFGNGVVLSGKFKDGKKVEQAAVALALDQKIHGGDTKGAELNKSEDSRSNHLNKSGDKNASPNDKEISAQADVKRLMEENSRLVAQIGNQAEVDKNLRIKLEKEAVDALTAQLKAQYTNEENIKLKAQIEKQAGLDRNIRTESKKLTTTSNAARKKERHINDENVNQKSRTVNRVATDKYLSAKLGSETATASVVPVKSNEGKQEAENNTVVDSRAKMEEISSDIDAKKYGVVKPVDLLEIQNYTKKVTSEAQHDNLEIINTTNLDLSERNSKESLRRNIGTSIDSGNAASVNNVASDNPFANRQNTTSKNFFITSSLNLVDITASNFFDTNSLFGKSKFGGAPKDLPYSVGFGYNFAENYGLELSFKNHGEQMSVPAVVDERIFKSSSILIGGFFEFPIDPKLSLGLKYGAHSTESTYSAKNYLYTIDNQDSFKDYDFVNKSINDYYGYSISYSINRQNKLSLNWIRLQSVFSVVGDSTTPYSTDINTDVTEIAYKYNF